MTTPKVKRLVFQLGMRHRYAPRCEASVLEATARWRNHLGKDYRCELSALYLVDGHYFCKRHAGDRLLGKLCTGDHLVDRSTRAAQPAATKAKR